MLEGADRLAEGLAVLGVLDRLLEDRLGVGDVGDRGTDALLRQALHHRDEAHPLGAETVLVGHADVLEEELGRVGLVHADLVELASVDEALHAALDHEQRDALGALGRVGPGGHDDEVGLVAVGDEGLGAVEDPGVTVADGGRLEGGEVGAAGGLGHRDGADELAARHAGQPALLLLLGAEVDDVGRAHVGVDAEAGARRGVEAGHLLGDDGVEAVVVDAGAAELLGDVETEEALLAGLEPDVARDRLALDHLLGAGRERAGDELARRRAHRLVVLVVDVAGHGVLHRACSRVRRAGTHR